MSRLFYHTMQDNVGNLLFDVSGTMRIAGSGTVATIYGDEALTVILPNPMTNHPSFGSFKCFLGAGDYDFYMAKSGYTFETLTGVQGHGSMAQQDASAVNITGGVATLGALTVTGNIGVGGAATITGQLDVNNVVASNNVQARQVIASESGGGPQTGFHGSVAVGTDKYNLYLPGTAQNYVQGALGIGGAVNPNGKVTIAYDKTAVWGLILQQLVTDAGGIGALLFLNTAGSSVGSIVASNTATAYNTASDSRLKEAVAPLSGALDVVRRLTPVSFRWKADGSPGQGLIAQDVAAIVPAAVSGTADGDVPMGLDYSKLVPWLVSAVKELTQQVERLQAQLAVVGE